MYQGSYSGLKFLVFGVGAIGTYIGGSLALYGQTVVFIERPECVEGIRKNGLHLRLDGKEHEIIEPDVVGSIEAALTHGPYDVGILAVKSYDTAGLLDSLGPYRAALPPVLCLQNGIDNEPALANLLGAERVIRGTVTTAIGRRGAGDIAVERLRGVGVANEHLLVSNLVGAMNAAGLNAQLFSNGKAMKWSKLLTNLIANATSAILGMPPSEILANPGLYRMEIQQFREALSVMRGLNLPVVDLPGTPVNLLAFMVRALPPALSQPLMRQALGRGRGGKMPSFYLDLYSGRGKSEVDFLNGAVVRAGASLKIKTPVNQLLNETLMALTNGSMSKDEFVRQPERLLGLLRN